MSNVLSTAYSVSLWWNSKRRAGFSSTAMFMVLNPLIMKTLCPLCLCGEPLNAASLW
jgi:hypothetical protein